MGVKVYALSVVSAAIAAVAAYGALAFAALDPYADNTIDDVIRSGCAYPANFVLDRETAAKIRILEAYCRYPHVARQNSRASLFIFNEVGNYLNNRCIYNYPATQDLFRPCSEPPDTLALQEAMYRAKAICGNNHFDPGCLTHADYIALHAAGPGAGEIRPMLSVSEVISVSSRSRTGALGLRKMNVHFFHEFTTDHVPVKLPASWDIITLSRGAYWQSVETNGSRVAGPTTGHHVHGLQGIKIVAASNGGHDLDEMYYVDDDNVQVFPFRRSAGGQRGILPEAIFVSGTRDDLFGGALTTVSSGDIYIADGKNNNYGSGVDIYLGGLPTSYSAAALGGIVALINDVIVSEGYAMLGTRDMRGVLKQSGQRVFAGHDKFLGYVPDVMKAIALGIEKQRLKSKATKHEKTAALAAVTTLLLSEQDNRAYLHPLPALTNVAHILVQGACGNNKADVHTVEITVNGITTQAPVVDGIFQTEIALDEGTSVITAKCDNGAQLGARRVEVDATPPVPTRIIHRVEEERFLYAGAVFFYFGQKEAGRNAITFAVPERVSCWKTEYLYAKCLIPRDMMDGREVEIGLMDKAGNRYTHVVTTTALDS